MNLVRGEPQQDFVVHGNVDISLEFPGAVIAAAGGQGCVEFVDRLFRDDADRTDLGAASEERLLRPLENLDAVDIVKFHDRAARPAERDAVEEDGDTRIFVCRAAVGRDASDREARVIGTLRRDLESGHEGREIVESLDPVDVEKLRAIGGDRDRHREDRFLALLRSDDDLLHAARLRRGLSGLSQRRDAVEAREARDAEMCQQSACAIIRGPGSRRFDHDTPLLIGVRLRWPTDGPYRGNPRMRAACSGVATGRPRSRAIATTSSISSRFLGVRSPA